MHAHACAQSLARPGDFDRARTLYEKVLRARPYRQLLFYALNNLALLHDTTGNLERAEETLRYALQLSACGPHQSFCRQCHKSHDAGPLRSAECHKEAGARCSICGEPGPDDRLRSCVQCAQQLCDKCHESWRVKGLARDPATLRNYGRFLHTRRRQFTEAEEVFRLAFSAGAWRKFYTHTHLHSQVRQSVAVVMEDLASKEGLRHRAPHLF